MLYFRKTQKFLLAASADISNENSGSVGATDGVLTTLLIAYTRSNCHSGGTADFLNVVKGARVSLQTGGVDLARPCHLRWYYNFPFFTQRKTIVNAF